MGQDNTGKPSTPAPPNQDAPSQDSSSQEQPIAGAAQDDQGAQAAIPAATAADQPAADDLLHAAHVAPPADMVANVELTLDHLSTTVDLFDVPPFDYGDTGYSDTGGGGDVG
jgi:hypothetical protein